MNMWDFFNAHIPSQACVAVILLGALFIWKTPPSALDIAKEILLEFKDLFSNGMTSKGLNALGGLLVFFFVVGVMINDPIERMIGLVGNDHEAPDFPHKEIIFCSSVLLILAYFIICILITKTDNE